MIDVTSVDLRTFANAVFKVSGGTALSDEAYASCLIPPVRSSGPVLIMNDVDSIPCHMVVLSMFGRRFVRVHWPDHTDDQLRDMLSGLGIELESHELLGHETKGSKRNRLAVPPGLMEKTNNV